MLLSGKAEPDARLLHDETGGNNFARQSRNFDPKNRRSFFSDKTEKMTYEQNWPKPLGFHWAL